MIAHRRQFAAVAAVLAVAAGCAHRGDVDTGSSSRGVVTVSVVGTADLHGAVLAESGRGGLTLLGGYLMNLRQARAADGGAVLLVDAGDAFQGTLESNVDEGATVIAAYNALGYDAAAIGNHEFDFGPVGEKATPSTPGDDPQGALKARAAEARFPLLAANVIDRATGAPIRWPNVAPSVLFEATGVRVGVVGVTTESTPATTIAANLDGLAIEPLVPAIVREAQDLRARGAAVVVVAAHAGGRCGEWHDPDDLSSCNPNSEIFRAARALPPGLVDVIVAGHSHERLAHRVSGTVVIQAGSSGRAFGRADVLVEQRTGRVTSERIFPPQDVCSRVNAATGACVDGRAGTPSVAAVYEGRPVAPDAAVESVLEPAGHRVDALKKTSLGVVLEEPFRRERLIESALGNLLTDAVRASKPGTDVVLLNGGGIRADLPAGELTYGDLFEVFPFDNRLVTLTMRGEQLRRVIAHNLQSSGPVPQILSVSGVDVTAECVGATLQVQLSRPSGAPLTDPELVRVTTVDFVATGGDGVLAPAGPLPETALTSDDTPLLRDVVAEWLRNRGGRLHPRELLDEEARCWVFPGSRPVRCDDG